MKDYDLLYRDKHLSEIIDSINTINKDYLLACHGRYHTMFVVDTVEELLNMVCEEERTIELGMIAALLHDIGTIYGKKGHALRSSEMCMEYLDKTGLTNDEKDIVKHSIEDHSNGDMMVSPIGAALVLADKINLTKDRVLELGIRDKWLSNILNIDKVDIRNSDGVLEINYLANDEFDIDVFKDGFSMFYDCSLRAGKYLGFNDVIFMYNNIEFGLEG